MSEYKKLPESRLGRLGKLASMGLRAGVGSLFSKDGESPAQHAAEVLGHLRGIAAKVGQMASYVDGVIPEAHREAYEKSMKSLQAQAPKSSPEEIRRAVEEEFQAPLDKLFVEWIDSPIASASIGQVHRARLHDGREVAVKVQHPGIVNAMKSDLKNTGIIESFVNLAGGKRFNAKDILQTIRDRLNEELDYHLEADRLQQFRQLHAEDHQIVIPELITSHSSKRVITTEFAHGASFDEACAGVEKERRQWAETLWRFVFRGILVGRMLNADPHPGNYVFRDDGRVVFFDYGCVQVLNEERHHLTMMLHYAALRKDEGDFRTAAIAALKTKAGRLEDLAHEYTRRCFNALFQSPYVFERAYVVDLVNSMKDMAQFARKVPEDELFVMPNDLVFFNRLQFGFYSVLARLQIDADYSGEEERLLQQANMLPT